VFYMYERRYAAEPFTAVEPSAPVDWTFGPRGAERAEAAWFRFAVDNVQDRETAVAASWRRVRVQAEDHSIRKDLGLASGRERPPRRSRPGCIRGSLVGRATRTAQSAVLSRTTMDLQPLGRMTYDCGPPLVSDRIGCRLLTRGERERGDNSIEAFCPPFCPPASFNEDARAASRPLVIAALRSRLWRRLRLTLGHRNSTFDGRPATRSGAGAPLSHSVFQGRRSTARAPMDCRRREHRAGRQPRACHRSVREPMERLR
jgi:hypothetical protein